MRLMTIYCQKPAMAIAKNYLPLEHSLKAPEGIIIGSILTYFYNQGQQNRHTECITTRRDHVRRAGSGGVTRAACWQWILSG